MISGLPQLREASLMTTTPTSHRIRARRVPVAAVQWHEKADLPYVIKNRDGTGLVRNCIGETHCVYPGDYIVTFDDGTHELSQIEIFSSHYELIDP